MGAARYKKPLKRLATPAFTSTGLKAGVNEKVSIAARMISLFAHEIGGSTFRTGDGHFPRHRPSKFPGVTANQAAPGEGARFS